MAVSGISPSSIDLDSLTQEMRRAADSVNSKATSAGDSGKSEFLDLLEKGMNEVNTASKQAEEASMDLASGKSSNIHETMLAVTKAELGFNMMVQLRNKVIESYQEVMRMQV